MTDIRQLQEEMQQIQQQLDERKDEATKLERQLDMALTQNQQDPFQRAKGQGGDIQASAQRGRIQEVEEEINVLQQRLTNLQARVENQGATPQAGVAYATPPEHDPTVGAPTLAVGSMAWVEQNGGISAQLRTNPSDEGGMIAKLPSGTQMTVLDGPEDVDGHTWWRVRTTNGKEGWVAEDGLRAH